MQTVNLERADKKRSRDYQNINEDTLQCREKCHNKFTEFVLFFFLTFAIVPTHSISRMINVRELSRSEYAVIKFM